MKGGATGGGRYIYILYLAVVVLFVHAIIQQRIMSSIRAEIRLARGMCVNPSHTTFLHLSFYGMTWHARLTLDGM